VKYKKYYASHFYSLSGADKMKAELYKNGPISCGIQATTKFETTYGFNGGIYKEYIELPEINHEIAIVGWGTDEESGDEYWIGRNSWGTYWGTYGFFRLPIEADSGIDPPIDTYNLGVQTDCTAGLPSFHDSASLFTEFIQ